MTEPREAPMSDAEPMSDSEDQYVTLQRIIDVFSDTIFWNYMVAFPGDKDKEPEYALEVKDFGVDADDDRHRNKLIVFSSGEIDVTVARLDVCEPKADAESLIVDADVTFMASLPVYIPFLLNEISRLARDLLALRGENEKRNERLIDKILSRQAGGFHDAALHFNNGIKAALREVRDSLAPLAADAGKFWSCHDCDHIWSYLADYQPAISAAPAEQAEPQAPVCNCGGDGHGMAHHRNDCPVNAAALARWQEQEAVRWAAAPEASKSQKSPLEQTIDDLWRDIILARKPNYGDWEYGGFAYRHIMEEFREVCKERDDAVAALSIGGGKPQNETLKSLASKHALAIKALLPNERAAAADWKAKKFSDDEACILAPAYRHDPRRRHMVGYIRIDGFTNDEAQANGMAVADFLVESANYVISASAVPATTGEGKE